MRTHDVTATGIAAGDHATVSNNAAMIFRSAALFAILYQFRLVSGDLADTVIFSAALCTAFAAAAFLFHINLYGKKVNAFAAMVTIGLLPWIARTLIAAPGLLFSSVSLDSLLFNFDRNNFAALLPFYWTAVTSWFALRSRTFLRAAVMGDAVLLTVVFSCTPAAGIEVYRWPVVMISLIAGIVFTQALALLFSLPPGLAVRKSEKLAAVAALLALVFAGGLLFLKPSQERAVQKGGGLLEPNLFSFDFSQFLRLDTEISMNDDLVLIVKKDPDDDHTLLRRSVLSGYGRKQGFYRVDAVDEKAHPQRLPARPVQLSPPEFESARRVRQEFFVVNFDAAAFIGLKEPAEIIPYESWDSSSFKSAYAVESLTSDAGIDVIDIAWPAPAEFGLSVEELTLYTNYGGDERIKALAEEVTRGIEQYRDKVYMVQDWLKYGEYRYSLKPGIAPDGDQLAWFLFQSKKGYCSYYAFAMALMLRSLGIPSRVAAGFFIDPASSVFDYYAVRSDMAHAWVEVLFPGYGWIEFDPTSENLAEGEDFRFSSGVDPRLFERLMREILENRSRLRARMGTDGADPLTETYTFMRLTAAVLKKVIVPMLLLLFVILCGSIRCGRLLLSMMSRNKRTKAVHLWKHVRGRLRLAGIACPPSLSEAEWALRGDALVKGTYAVYQGYAAARFASEYRDDDFMQMLGAYRVFSGAYRNSVSLPRRFLAWVFPPIAWMRRKTGLTLLLLIVLWGSTEIRAQEPADDLTQADALYHSALEAEYAEYWERAIDLFREGGRVFPGDSRFPRALGNLYYNRSLYGLAWDEYRRVELMDPFDTYVLLRLANTAAYLNRDQTSVAYLEKLLALDPDNQEAVSNLGWMYYKVHRLEDGERLLISALERFGDEADIAMTLATIYSDMYRYDDGKHWYQKAIALAEPERTFTSVGHYNLSILESRFLRYELAMREANASLTAQNRASGHLARGELSARRLELRAAQADYQTAREMDSSPLAKVSLAQIYQVSGRLEEARLYALDCLQADDQSWMMHFGIDPVRYRRDIHEILWQTYRGIAQAARFRPYGTPAEWIRSVFTRISCRFYAEVHRLLFQKYSLAAGNAYGRVNRERQSTASGSPPLEQLIQYYNAFESYPRRAFVYLNKARAFETTVIPDSAGSYVLEEGVLLRDRTLLAQALNALDPVWERDLIAGCYRELALSGRRAARRTAAGELFALNRGALLQAGIGLPVEIHARSGDLSINEKKLNRILAQAGFIHDKAGDDAARFRLDVTFSESAAGLSDSPDGVTYTVSCELSDRDGELNTLTRVISLRSLSGAGLRDFAGTLSDMIFRVE